MQEYLTRLSQLADDVMNCSAVLNWLEVSTELSYWLKLKMCEKKMAQCKTFALICCLFNSAELGT